MLPRAQSCAIGYKRLIHQADFSHKGDMARHDFFGCGLGHNGAIVQRHAAAASDPESNAFFAEILKGIV